METGGPSAAAPQAASAEDGGGYFENIDIQPIGTTVMETGVLKEPRGAMRLLQWFFAICAFATCADFTARMEYVITCKSAKDGAPEKQDEVVIRHNTSYPFVPSDQVIEFTCGGEKNASSPPGDFASDAQFFVFTGVVSFLATMAILVVYVFFAPIYESENKRPPLYDFCFTVVIAVFWLTASSAWANGLVGLKSVYGGDWIFGEGEFCAKASNGDFATAVVRECKVMDEGHYGGANVSVLLGFLNCFLWTSNLWFLYKETAWFAGGGGPMQQQQQMQG